MILAIPSPLGKGPKPMLALVRHGSYHLSTGHLDAIGIDQSHKIAQILSQFSPWDQILASPSLRTQETAHELQAFIRAPISLEETISPTNSAEGFYPPPPPGRLILVTHAPVLHGLMRAWTKFFSQPPLPLLSVGEAYIILPEEREMRYLKAV